LLATATGMAAEWMRMALKPAAASNMSSTVALSCECLESPEGGRVVTWRSHVSSIVSVSA
jgi:hypothetical protein